MNALAKAKFYGGDEENDFYSPSEDILENFDDNEPHMREDGAITDGNGNVLIRGY